MGIINDIQKNEQTIVALGDSLTYGWMVSKGYLCFLREMLSTKYNNHKFNIINSGNPGDTARCGLYRMTNDVIRHNPNLVLIQFALNDAFNEISISEYKNNLLKISKEISEKTNAIPIYVTSSNIMNSEDNYLVHKYYEAMEECAIKMNNPIAKVHDLWNLRIKEGARISSLVQTDGVHPSNSGHRLIAESISAIL